MNETRCTNKTKTESDYRDVDGNSSMADEYNLTCKIATFFYNCLFTT